MRTSMQKKWWISSTRLQDKSQGLTRLANRIGKNYRDEDNVHHEGYQSLILDFKKVLGEIQAEVDEIETTDDMPF